jgi:hypothetical protein
MAIVTNDWTGSIVASRWVDDGDAETPGRGNYFCAIEVIAAATFDQLISEKMDEYDTDTDSSGAINASDTPSKNSIYMNTEDSDAGNQIVNSDSFPVGTILYGKWTKFELAGGKVIAYECN